MAARITAYLVALIVGVTFIAGLLVGAQRQDGPVDLIVVNGSVYTADGEGTMAEAVAVQGNKILMVGSNRDVQRLRRPRTVVVDAQGGAVLPGFIDSHAQFVSEGLRLQQVNLSDFTTLMGVESEIKAWMAANPDREWVTGRGWHYDVFDGDLPTRHLLDELVPDRPALLVADDGEAAWVNSMALRLARITRRTPSPPSGIIVRDPLTAEPTGVLKGAAISLVGDLVPTATREERAEGVRAAIAHAHRRGVTSVQHAHATENDLELYNELRRGSDLDIRVYAALGGHTGLTPAELDTLDQLRETYDDDPLFKAGGMTLVAEPDVPAQELAEMVAELDERGWQVIIEAIGDEAVRVALDAIEFAIGLNGAPHRERRHRIEHAEPADEIDAVRFQKLGVITAMQPQVGAADALQDPVLGVHAGVNRTLPDGVAAGGWMPADRMTLREAIDAYTRDPAWASYDEHRKGSLARDMLADLVILTDDIFSIAPSRLADTDIAVTIFDGKVVYSRSTESND
ncbi:MAG TPA: amidohydrolase [Vicinamibacterales bacterium]|nr:amidohydrolase [Vicinamibacterales bacterium]